MTSITRNSPIFAIPRYDYASYRDLYRLIELSEFPTCHIDEIDPQSDNAYIITIFNGEIPPGGYHDARARICLWDMEWHLDGVWTWNKGVQLPGVEIWAGDKWYAEQIGARYVPMGSHIGLAQHDGYYPAGFDVAYAETVHHDVAYIGYIAGVPRRAHVRHELIQRGVKVSPPTAWGGERHVVLSHSTAYLHVHQHANVPTIAPLRMAVAAAYSLPVITETVADAGMFSGFIAPILACQYHDIAADVEALVHREQKKHLLVYEGQCLHQHLCVDYTFRKSVEAAI